MAENKKFWYIQLNVNFFEDERIDWLCEQKNGYAYVVLYLKLCLKTANNNGILTRQIGDMIIPYNVDKIAEVTHMNVDVVRVALELYKKIGLVYEADENHNFMRLPEVPGMVGYITQAAIYKRRQREKNPPKALDIGVDTGVDIVHQELRVKSKELRDKSIEKEDEGNSSTLSAVMTAYMDKINPTPSPVCLEELKGYVNQMGAECCLRAINIALDEKKTTWSYIRAILRNKLSQGVRCIADWDALDAKREEEKNGGTDTSDSSGPKTWNGYVIHSVLDD